MSKSFVKNSNSLNTYIPIEKVAGKGRKPDQIKALQPHIGNGKVMLNDGTSSRIIRQWHGSAEALQQTAANMCLAKKRLKCYIELQSLFNFGA